MTQQEIEVFLTVARLGSVSAAAQALYITQPAVSRHLRALEEALGCILVSRGRGKRQAELTDRGRDFVRVAEKWRLLWQEAREVAGQDRTQTLRVASVGAPVHLPAAPGIPGIFGPSRPDPHLPPLPLPGGLRLHRSGAGGHRPDLRPHVPPSGGDRPRLLFGHGAAHSPRTALARDRPPLPTGPGQGAAPALEPGVRPVALLLVQRGGRPPGGAGPDVAAGGVLLLVGKLAGQLGRRSLHCGRPPVPEAGADHQEAGGGAGR